MLFRRLQRATRSAGEPSAPSANRRSKTRRGSISFAMGVVGVRHERLLEYAHE